MNPLTNVKNINKLNEREAELGIASKSSWHQQYSGSAYIFIGGLPYDLTEGDIICVFSQYGEIVNINLVRDKKSGNSKGFCFIAYEDQRSTVLAVDNLNGIKLLGRTLRVDHVAEYRKPKEDENEDDVTKQLRQQGCAPRTPSPSPPPSGDEDEEKLTKQKDSAAKKSKKKIKKEKKKKKKKEKVPSSSSDSETAPKREPKREKQDRTEIKTEHHPSSNNGRGGHVKTEHHTSSDNGRGHHRSKADRDDESYYRGDSGVRDRASRGGRDGDAGHNHRGDNNTRDGDDRREIGGHSRDRERKNNYGSRDRGRGYDRDDRGRHGDDQRDYRDRSRDYKTSDNRDRDRHRDRR